jgi:uncharacterized tellurite resistance protein B-like protein
MRSYPRNSPEAAARILALVLISDGHGCRTEFEALKRLDGVRHLGLDPEKLQGIVQTFCEDLLMEGFDGRSILSQFRAGMMASLLREVDDPHLQAQVMRLATSVAYADKHLSESETEMVEAISGVWEISRPELGLAGSV